MSGPKKMLMLDAYLGILASPRSQQLSQAIQCLTTDCHIGKFLPDLRVADDQDVLSGIAPVNQRGIHAFPFGESKLSGCSIRTSISGYGRNRIGRTWSDPAVDQLPLS